MTSLAQLHRIAKHSLQNVNSTTNIDVVNITTHSAVSQAKYVNRFEDQADKTSETQQIDHGSESQVQYNMSQETMIFYLLLLGIVGAIIFYLLFRKDNHDVKEVKRLKNSKFSIYNPAFGNLFSCSGRINRLHYVIYTLILYVFFIFLVWIMISLGIASEAILYTIIILRWFLSLPLVAKRFHDFNLSVSYYVIYSIFSLLLSLFSADEFSLFIEHIIGGIDTIIALTLLFKKGTNENNRFGISPLNPKEQKND